MKRSGRVLLAVSTLAAAVAPGSADEQLRITFAHSLSDFSGTVRLAEARLAPGPPGSGEVAVAQGREVRFFNRNGMQEFRFSISMELGNIFDVAVEPDDTVLTLAYALDAPGDRPRYVITRHDYRGSAVGEVTPTGLPPRFSGLLPNRLFLQPDGIVLASTGQLLAVSLDRDGGFRRGYDLLEILGIDPAESESHDLTTVTSDRDGNLLITCAQLFRAFVVSPAGRLLESWGEAGSGPGTFGLVSGIARDAAGRFFVADQLRGTISVFDDKLGFVQEFGAEPMAGGRLGIPKELMFDDLGRLFVTQVGERGVWVFVVEVSGP